MDVVLSGYHVPAGTFCFLLGEVTSKMEENFPDPGEFRPERFLRGHEEQSKANAFAHIPFGHGEWE